MADLKISQLTDGGASQAADEYVIARSGANYRIDGASVAAAATSVGTLTSLTVSGNLAVDTNTLYVDAANNQVGMGRTPNGYTLDITTGGNALRMERSGVEMGGFISSSLPHWGSLTNHDFLLMTNGTVKARLDTSGNLGLGVTPSAWSTNIFRTLQVGTGAGSVSFSGRTDGGSDMVLGKNLYNVSGTFYYVANGVATMYRTDGGSHAWSSYPSGTAGNALGTATGTMTLDASGRLQLNTTTAYTRVTIKGSAGVGNGYGILGATANTGCYFGAISATADDDFEIWNERTGYLRFGTANAERARITSDGNFLIGDTSGTHKLTVSVPSGADREMVICGVTGASNGFRVQWNHATLKTHVSITDIPTSSAGLPAGTLYSDGGTIKIA